MAHDVGDDFDDAFDAELGFPRGHAFGGIGGSFANDFEDFSGEAAVFPFDIGEGNAGEFCAGKGAAEVGGVAGGAVLLEGGFAGCDGGGVEGHCPEFGVVEGFEFLEPGVVDFCHGVVNAFLIGLDDAELVVGEPVEDEEGDGDVEGEEPPVGEFLIVFLDAVVDVVTQDGGVGIGVGGGGHGGRGSGVFVLIGGGGCWRGGVERELGDVVDEFLARGEGAKGADDEGGEGEDEGDDGHDAGPVVVENAVEHGDGWLALGGLQWCGRERGGAVKVGKGGRERRRGVGNNLGHFFFDVVCLSDFL